MDTDKCGEGKVLIGKGDCQLIFLFLDTWSDWHSPKVNDFFQMQVLYILHSRLEVVLKWCGTTQKQLSGCYAKCKY